MWGIIDSPISWCLSGKICRILSSVSSFLVPRQDCGILSRLWKFWTELLDLFLQFDGHCNVWHPLKSMSSACWRGLAKTSKKDEQSYIIISGWLHPGLYAGTQFHWRQCGHYPGVGMSRAKIGAISFHGSRLQVACNVVHGVSHSDCLTTSISLISRADSRRIV